MAFKGITVHLSRNLVAPESFDTVHDALKFNGANICLCADPSANSPNHYHVISSSDHEKFASLSAKGCNLIGPECVLRCAKEHRSFPQQAYTCCLAMDGVKILASGFENEEKVNIEKLVTAMCGELQTKTSLDLDFLVAKDVLAAKYKWAANVLRKPIVTIDWLHRCWHEHRLVPHEPYKMLPFTALIISATGIPPDERKQIEGLIIQHGGHYSADLTKKCTHLLCNIAEGAKYKVARRWGHIKIVNQKWVSQSISARASLDEEFYPVEAQSSSLPINGIPQYKQEKEVPSLPVPPIVQSSVLEPVSSTPSMSPALTNMKSETTDLTSENISDNTGCIVGDSQNGENDLYLENCRVLLVGFEPVELRRLIRMVWSGGGSRYMSFNEKLTHIIVGRPSESELKEIRKLTMWGVVNAVNSLWLEDCTRNRQEVNVSERHIISEQTLFQGIKSQEGPGVVGSRLSFQNQDSTQSLGSSKLDYLSNERRSPAKNQEMEVCRNESLYMKKADMESKLQSDTTSGQHLNGCVSKMENVFGGYKFGFSKDFPENMKSEIIEWVIQGSGVVVEDAENKKVDFIIESHGSSSNSTNYTSCATVVTGHWIRYCLEEGAMLDDGSHILYKPLPCQIPFPSFQNIRFSVSQYDEKDRLLLRNLCHVLGAKFTGKLNRKVTHLLCIYAGGPKYEAACSWGIEAVTADWIYACVRQDKLLPLHAFRPREMTAEERDAGLYAMTQYPTQATHLASKELPSQWQSDSQGPFVSESQRVKVGGEHHDGPASKKRTGDRKSNKRYQNSNGSLKRISASLEGERSSDPWDEQCILWSEGMGKSSAKFEESSKVSFKRPKGLQEKTTPEQGKDTVIDSTFGELTKYGDKQMYSAKESVESFPKCVPRDIAATNEHHQQTGRIVDSDATLDVATAIEDLIAQSELLHNDSRNETTNNRTKISPEYPSIARYREEPSSAIFRVPNEYTERHEKDDENQNIFHDFVNKAHDGFNESQMESQVIRYEVENTAKKKLMEKIQTRSMTSERNNERDQIDNGLARLLNVVDSGGKQKSKRKK